MSTRSSAAAGWPFVLALPKSAGRSTAKGGVEPLVAARLPGLPVLSDMCGLSWGLLISDLSGWCWKGTLTLCRSRWVVVPSGSASRPKDAARRHHSFQVDYVAPLFLSARRRDRARGHPRFEVADPV